MDAHPAIAEDSTSGMDRRRFLVRAGLAVGAGGLALAAEAAARPPLQTDLGSWEAVRDQFDLSRDLIHMAGFYLASHPRPVREAIETHRRGLDADPIGYHHATNDGAIVAVLQAAAEYLGVAPGDVALTDSTTMGLGLLYGGLALRPEQEVLTTEHDFYATVEALRLRAERSGARVRTIPLYQDLATVSAEEIVATLRREIRPETRIIAVTWVHSSTGLTLPIRAMADAVAEVNAERAEGDRALLCVDGVHGLGVEAAGPVELGCDFFVAGCHKWLFGPRGTGLVWGALAAWPAVTATIPSFDIPAFGGWSPAAAMTPGGFHSFEHRWALDQAFRFHLAIGKPAVAERIHALNRQLKEGLATIDQVILHTPLADDLSAGIVCFEVAGMASEDVVARLRERRIVASVAPYATAYARLAPGLLTSEAEVDETLAAVRDVVGG